MPKATTLHPTFNRAKRSRKELATLKRERSAWLASLASEAPFLPILDHIPGIFFFAKDRAGRTMLASRGVLERYHMRGESEMLGLTDFDLNPNHMAGNYVSDDERLLTGKAKHIERMELWFDRQGLPDWYFVTKLPLLDKRGRPQGVMGVLRRAEEHEKRLPLFQTVAKAVDIIRHDYAKPLVIADIALACGESLRQLQRRFQTAFGVTTQEFLIKTRVLAAARLLEETSLTAAEIGTRCGFVDASSFTEHFRQRTGMTPSAYRQMSG